MNWKEAVEFCEEHECEECVIHKKELNIRTIHEKRILHVPCCANLVDEFRIQHGAEPIGRY